MDLLCTLALAFARLKLVSCNTLHSNYTTVGIFYIMFYYIRCTHAHTHTHTQIYIYIYRQ